MSAIGYLPLRGQQVLAMLCKRDTSLMHGPPCDLPSLSILDRMRRDTSRAFNLTGCTGWREITHLADDTSGTVEHDRAGLEYPVAGIDSALFTLTKRKA